MPFVTTRDETPIFYKDWGSGPPVVLIHGWPLHADMWEYQAPALVEAGFRVIAYDRRGFGRSGQPWGGYDYDTMAGDLAALMDHLDLSGAALVGFSMGGGEVARYLSRHGAARVSKAVLLAAVTPYLLKDATNPDGAEAALFEGMIAGITADRPGFFASFGKSFMGAGLLNFSVSSAFLDWVQGMALVASPRATTQCVRAFGETDFRHDMAAFTMPTLIMHGDADQQVPIAVSARVAASMIPVAKLVEFRGAPHGLFFTEKDRVNAELLTFLRA